MTSEIIEYNGRRYAEYLPCGTAFSQTQFFSAGTNGFQFGVLVQPNGHEETVHTHELVRVDNLPMSEFLFVQRGMLTVSFYSDQKERFRDVCLKVGDALLLIDGPHSYRVDEDVQAIIVKQGPPSRGGDKIPL